MFQKSFNIILIIFSLILVFSCSTNKKKTLAIKEVPPLDKLYKSAYENFEKGNYQLADDLFKQVEKDYSYTIWAPKSLLMRSYIYYDSSEYIAALTNLQKFKKRYAGNDNYVYAEYLIALCLFEQINFASLSQENTELALKQFEKIIKNYPNTKYATDSKFKIDLINEQFAAKEMYLARYYIKREKLLPAMYRLNNIVNNYQTTIFIEEALHRLVEINYYIGNIESAKRYAAILGYNYNDSDWYKKSYNIVEGTNIPIEKQKTKKNFKEVLKELIN